MVSIWCLTYNHVNYIRDALEGFLMQETDFSYEVVVYDDASTDGTSDIVIEYSQKYPDIIHAIVAKENTYHNSKRAQIILDLKRKYLRGRYIAHCEGDDVWIDCYKLRLQIEYMEKHKGCSMYLHNALWLNCEDGTIKVGNHFQGNDEQDVTAEEIIMQYRFHPPMASMIYKREAIEKPVFFLEAPVGDYPALLYALTRGTIHYTNRIMSIYRWKSNGSYSETIKKDPYLLFHFNMGLLDFFIKYNLYTNYKYYVWCMNKIHLFISGIIDNVNYSIELKDFLYCCKNKGYTFSIECEGYLEEIERLRKQTFDMSYCSNDTRNFIRKFKYNIIMGAGKYGAIVSKQFSNNKIHFVGFTVSEKGDKDFYMGKPVWGLEEIPYEKKSTGIIIAINPLRWDTIQKALENAGIKNFYCPFAIQLDRIF